MDVESVYNFNEAQKLLTNNNCKVKFKSLSSNKVLTGTYNIPRTFQSDSDKILVWDIDRSKWEDIQLDTILSIEIV